jgi:hypothetical protein
MDPRDLADDAGFVGDRTAGLDALLVAEVDEDLVGVRVAPGVQDLGGRGLHRQLFGRADQAAQLRGFRFGRLETLCRLRQGEVLGAQRRVFIEQPCLGREIVPHGAQQIDRRRGGPLQRIGGERKHAAESFGVAKAGIEHQQRER